MSKQQSFNPRQEDINELVQLQAPAPYKKTPRSPAFDELNNISKKVMKNPINIKIFFETVAELENNLEMHKQNMVNQNEDFNTIDAFRLIDQEGEGVVSLNDLEDFVVNSLGIRYKQSDLTLFIKRFDKNDRNQIKYSQFCNAFAPINETFKAVLGERRPSNTNLEKTYR